MRRCRGRRRCAFLVAVRLVADVDGRLALEDVEDGVEALWFGGRNGDLAEVEATPPALEFYLGAVVDLR